MPRWSPAVDPPSVTGLRNRLGPAARASPDLGLLACLVLPWLIGAEQFWVHLAYIFAAVSAFGRPGGRGTLLRVATVTLIGGAALVRVQAQGGLPAHELLELPLLAALPLLFAAFTRQRVRAEQNVLRDQQRLARVVDRIPLATIAFDAEAHIVTWNTAAEQLFGWKPEEVIGRDNPIVPADQRDASNELFARMMTGERLHGIEVSRRARDGRTLELALYSAPLGRDGTLVLYDDIHERKQLERERDQAQRRYQDLIESVPLVTYIDRVDDNATNVYTSPQAVDLLGWPLSDWANDPCFFERILHPDDRERVMAEVLQANETREEFDSEYRLRHRDGTYVWVRDRSAILDGHADEPFARGFLLDITQQKQLEAQLFQSQKMDALGQFAGGIAHDFNNLLTGIGGYADLAVGGTEPDSLVARCLDGIKTAADEAASLTSRLLAFSRRNVPERKLVDVNEIVREAASMLERLVRADVRVKLDLTHPLPAVAADLVQLKQLVVNLALNARDAMGDGGTLTIETTVVAGSVVLRVRDTGAGMDAATRARAIEPFFTTKPEGKGTGLGLSVVYGVVDALGGRLSIDSAVGLGTIVEIALPAAVGVNEEAEAVDEASPVDGGAERVLVVEDRDIVRHLTRDLLESSGFDVIAVAGGGEALEAVAASEPFDLLLTDVVMPEMSGPELAQRLRAGRPALPVLYMSGYTDDVLDAHELSQEATAFLRKPFGNAELIAAVRGILDGHAVTSPSPV
jgi:PAS domain S-box-containing protein